MEKHSPQGEEHTFPPPGKRLCLELFSREPRLEFLLDISRGTIRITKYTFQNRGFKSVVLARLDIDGNPHRNPDGEDIGRTHLHLYDELYGDKWAYPPPPIFTNPCDAFLTLDQFLDFCHVVTKPVISRGLF
ncbi:MAG: hypothetical protein GX256_01675 [Fretibacterium sp.]|nr:hypothetical protein [Fretibacterium sp.]